MIFKIIRVKIFLFFLIISTFCFGQEWINTAIAGVGSLKFPTEPEIYDDQGVLIYKVENEDAFYLLTIMEFDLRYSADIKSNLDEFYEGNIKGALDASNGELINKESIKINNRRAVEFSFRKNRDNNLPSLHFKRVVYVSPFLVGLEYLPKISDEEKISLLKTKFFNSFQINQKSESAIDVNSQEESLAFNSGYSLGHYIGRFVFFGILILVILGIPLFFIVRRHLGKKKKQTAATAKESISSVNYKVCLKCETENRLDAKYCSKCGYALPK